MRTLILTAAMLSLGACAATDTGQTAAEGVAAAEPAFEGAFNSGNAAGVAALYTEDAVIMPPGSAALEGREAIQGLWQGFIDAGVTDLDLVTVSIDDQGDTATEFGRFTLAVPDGQGGMTTAAGKYIVQWKRGEDGAWRLHWDIWNNDPAG